MNDFDSDFEGMELPDNNDPEAPLVVVIDASHSMFQENSTLKNQYRVDADGKEVSTAASALEDGLDTFVEALEQDTLAARRVNISFIVFGSEVFEPTPWSRIDDDNFTLPALSPSGTTSMGAALERAMSHIKERKAFLKANGVSYFRPQLLILTDGAPTDSVDEARRLIAEEEEKKGIIFFPVGIEGADKKILDTLSSKRQGLMIKDMNMEGFFQWLSQSQSAVSASQPDADKIALPAPTDWMDV